MLVNKDCKVALSHSLLKDMNKLAGTTQYQSELINNLEEQLGLSKKTTFQHDVGMSVVRSEFENVKAY